MFKNDIIDVVHYIQIVDFDKIAFSSRRRIVKEFLKDTFKNVSIKTKDNKIIKMFNSGANKISQSTTNNQQEIALFSKELIQVAEFEKTVQSSNDKRFKGLIHFYKSFIIFNDKLLKVNLNIREDASGLNLYDINKIAVIGDTSSESWAYIPANTNLNDY